MYPEILNRPQLGDDSENELNRPQAGDDLENAIFLFLGGHNKPILFMTPSTRSITACFYKSVLTW